MIIIPPIYGNIRCESTKCVRNGQLYCIRYTKNKIGEEVAKYMQYCTICFGYSSKANVVKIITKREWSIAEAMET